MYDKIDGLTTREPVLVGPATSLRAVAQRLHDEGIGAVVVGTVDEPVGVVSERDIATAVARRMDLDATQAQQVMARPVLVVDAGDMVFEAALRMLDAGVRHVAVVTDGRITGIVSIRDLLRPLLPDAMARPI